MYRIMSQTPDIARRNPSQDRSVTTVNTLLEATARILESNDTAKLTTNHIAERAGFSIGTFYEYFPNKHSILQAMALREAKRQVAQVLQSLKLAEENHSIEDLVRIVIRAVLRPFEGRNRLRLAMLKWLSKDAMVLAAARAAQDNVLNVLLNEIAARAPNVMTMPGADTRFTLLAAISGAVQSAAATRMDIFETRAFEDEIVRLIMLSLQQRQEG
jgi:AcrR family transcriptional regulator